MRKIAFSAILTLLTIFCAGFMANTSHANLGQIVRTIPSPPIPYPDSILRGFTNAEGMLVITESLSDKTLPSKFHKIDPDDGTVLETIDFPFIGQPSGIAYDGSSLWVLNGGAYEIDLDGNFISQFDPPYWGYGWWFAHAIAVEGDHLWIGVLGENYKSKLFKLTKTGEILESYVTTDSVTYYMDLVLNTQYPAESNLFVVDYNGRAIKRLSTTGGSVTVVEQATCPTWSEHPTGLAFDGEFLWHSDSHNVQGEFWCLDDGRFTPPQATHHIEQSTNGGYNPWIKGQTFTPGIGIDPDPGSVSTLDLTVVRFFRSGQDWSGPTSHFYLNIYDGDPVNGTGLFVGSSINTVDVDLLGSFDAMTWEFDHLTLDYTHEYWALVSSTSTDGGLDVYCGMRESGPDLYGGGSAIAGITSDPDGYHVKGNDLAFQIGLELSGPIPRITANGSDEPITIDYGSNLTIELSLDPRLEAGNNADWWLLVDSPFGWYRYNLGSGNWTPGFRVTHQGPLSTFGPFTAYNGTTLPDGFYTFHFGVDMDMNGSLDMGQMYHDTVEVTVL